ncbi:MAG TPA: NAD(P)H-binding protein [Gemmatimonadaceae bacterium]|nr:NAD(P)H-binding protein [Gemmatimonadaceae bacterium]HRQ78359.1 NAD(P)H-binding protein [Gemmatimonadaceae bacterium]
MTTPRGRVLLVGASGSIGRATAEALTAAGYSTVAIVRPSREIQLPEAVEVRQADVNDAASLAGDAFCGERFDAVISCLASRSGAPKDAWAIDDKANRLVLDEAQRCGARHFVLLSAICVQKPQLAFQHAKLAFEETLIESGIRYSIVRPTAFFKSLSGQVERVKRGKPFLVFGDGRRTSCAPISDADVAGFLVECIADESRWNRILPVGGPGPALTPREQAAMLFELTGQPARFRSVSPKLLLAAATVLDALGALIPPLLDKAEFARIGYYYATESMLVWDEARGRYDADATPRYGRDTLREHYARLLRGELADDRGEHALFR